MPGRERTLQNYDVVAGVNSVVSDALGSRDQAEQDLRKLAPQLFEDTSERGQRILAENLNSMQKAIEYEKAQSSGSSIEKFAREKLAARPRNVFEVSLGRHPVNPIGANATVGGVMDFGGLGPRTLEEDPAGFAASWAALAAGQPNVGRALQGPARRLLPKRISTGAIETGEQMLTPAIAAATAGAAVRYGQGVVAEANRIPTVNVENDETGQSPMSDFAAAMNEARNQFVFETAGGAMGFLTRATGKGIAAFARGDKEYFDSAVKALRAAGLRGNEINLMTVSNRALFSSAGRTVGAIPIPIIGKRFRRAEVAKAEAMTRERERLIGDVSPRYRIISDLVKSDPEKATALMQASKKSFFSSFNAAIGRYRTVREGVDAGLQAALRREGPKIVTPAANARAAALYLVTQKGKKTSNLPTVTEVTEVASRLVDPKGKPLSITNRARRDVRNFNLEDKELNNVLRDIRDMDADVTVDKLINLRDNITARLDMDDPNRALSKSDAAALFEIGAALDSDIEQALLSQGSEGLQHLYSRLKTMDSDWITLITGSQASNRARRVQKTFGQQKASEASGETFGTDSIQRAQGSLDMEEFLDSMLASASPEEIRQVAILLRQSGSQGEDMLRFATARQLDRVLQPAIKQVTDDRIEVIKADVIRSAIEGKEGPLGKRATRFWALVKESGASRKDVENFINGADQLWRSLPSDPNTFLMRNLILNRGDLGSMVTKAMGLGVLGVGGGAAATSAAGNVIPAVFGTFALERFTHIVTNPRALTALNTILDPKTGKGAKARAVDRLLANRIFREWGDEKRRQANLAPARDMINQAADVYNRFDLPNNPLNRLTNEAANTPGLFDQTR